MKTQVTKRKLTLKTKKAKPAPDEAEGGAPAAAAAPGKTVIDTSYHKPGAIIAIIATVIFLALVTIQVLEWLYYQSPPSVWPPKIPAGAMR